MGDGRWAMGDGRWAMGDGRRATGDGRWATGRFALAGEQTAEQPCGGTPCQRITADWCTVRDHSCVEP
jgi:hypothetical protein